MTMIDPEARAVPLATLPTQPRYCLFTPAVRVPALTWPVAQYRGGVLACLQPRLGPREAQSQQLSALPAPQRGAYPGGSGRLRSCSPHKRMIDRRLRLANPLPELCSAAGAKPEWLLPY
jgi:hypothetical protein